MPNRLNPVNASPHLTPNPAQTGLPRVHQHVTASAEAGDDVISLMPEGKINIISDTDFNQDEESDILYISSDLLEDYDKFYAPHIGGGGDNNISTKILPGRI